MIGRPLLLVTVSALAACSSGPAARVQSAGAAAPTSVGFLAFGDHGYSLDYLAPDDLAPARDAATFVADARRKWIKEKRPAADFVASPLATVGGSTVAASGMMPVAAAMATYCQTVAKCQFGVMLGDNIYPDGATLGADGRDDARRFADILAAPYGKFGWGNDDFRIYSVLGNHDWHTSRAAAMAEVAYLTRTRPFYMDGVAYAAKPGGTNDFVEVFALDTHVLLAGEKVLEDKLADDGSEVATATYETPQPWAVPATPAERAMVGDLERRLKASTARWKIVIGHHPLWSSSGGKFRQSQALRAALLPVLCRNADLYFAGHEHTLEIAADDCSTALPGATVAPLPSIVTGAAGKQRPLNTAFMQKQRSANPQYQLRYARGMVWGFTHVVLDKDTATVTMLSTPNDGSGSARVESVERFARRSGSRSPD